MILILSYLTPIVAHKSAHWEIAPGSQLSLFNVCRALKENTDPGQATFADTNQSAGNKPRVQSCTAHCGFGDLLARDYWYVCDVTILEVEIRNGSENAVPFTSLCLNTAVLQSRGWMCMRWAESYWLV
jgi:hypothetical protein